MQYIKLIKEDVDGDNTCQQVKKCQIYYFPSIDSFSNSLILLSEYAFQIDKLVYKHY